MKLLYISLGICGAALAFLCVDCCAGKTRYTECRVTQHIYKPAYTTTDTHTDSNGNVSTDTVYHSEEYHLLCAELGGELVLDCNTTQTIYGIVTNEQIVTVCSRQGKWTGMYYLNHIQQ